MVQRLTSVRFYMKIFDNMKHVFAVISVIFLILFPGLADAQNIPSLPGDPAIVQSTLPNGIRCYLVSNPTRKGYADFALVQKVGRHDSDSSSLLSAVSVAKGNLAELPRFCTVKPQVFLSRKGFDAGKNGYVTVTDDATIYRFSDLKTSKGESVIDSTILAVFGIIEGKAYLGDSFFESYYGTDSQAIIIAGDIDVNSLNAKLRMLSYMVPARKSLVVKQDDYAWTPSDSMRVVVNTDSSAVSSITVSYRSPRIPRQYMPTVLPYISEQLGSFLGIILEKRIHSAMKAEGIPYSDFNCRFRRSVAGPGDEVYSISLNVWNKDLYGALSAMASVLADLDETGATEEECHDAYAEHLVRIKNLVNACVTDNDVYINKCIASYLYDASLASAKDRFAFISGREIPDSTNMKLFNNFASRLMDSQRNLILTCDTGLEGADEESIGNAFLSAWKTGAAVYGAACSADQADTLKLLVPEVKLKVKKSRGENTGGIVDWHFSNGMRVIYRKMATDGLMYYALVLRGGYSAMQDIGRGEGAFLSDMLGTSSIAGMSSESFGCLLRSNGIFMNADVSVSHISISGSAPSSRLPLVIKSLQAIANDRGKYEDFDYFRSCSEVKIGAGSDGLAGRMTAIDSILCPDYNYSSCKTMQGLSNDLPSKSEDFFRQQFSKTNDGALVLVGDIPEENMKKMLLKMVGGFRTQNRAVANRSILYQPVSSEITYTVDGSVPSVDIVMSSRLAMSIDNYYAARVAVEAMKKAVSNAASSIGMDVKFGFKVLMYPQERINVLVSAEYANLEGFADSVRHVGPIYALATIRWMLSKLSDENIDSAVLEEYKAALRSEIDVRQSDPLYWLEQISCRVAYGKDFMTSYADKINAVTPDKVREIISSLNGGSKVEYVIH